MYSVDSIETYSHKVKTFYCEHCGRAFKSYRQCECHEEFCERNKARIESLKYLVGKCYRVKFSDTTMILRRIQAICLKDGWYGEDRIITDDYHLTKAANETIIRHTKTIIPLDERDGWQVTPEREVSPDEFEADLQAALR